VKRTTYAVALLAALGALVIAGCGGSSSGSTSNEASQGSSGGAGESVANTPSASGMTVSGAEISGLGTVLVDSKGMTVYEFTVDKGTTSECYEECETAWPPVTASGKPSAGEGAMAADLGTTKRKDGTMQVTYKGHPIYTFAEDKAPGEANGNEAEGTWFVLNEAGTAVKGKATPAAATSEGESAASESGEEEGSEEGSGGGYGY
jgi:predicted lipoprotein with Yx(FWY)xxD motif